MSIFQKRHTEKLKRGGGLEFCGPPDRETVSTLVLTKCHKNESPLSRKEWSRMVRVPLPYLSFRCGPCRATGLLERRCEMNRTELIRRASKATGIPVAAHNLKYAMDKGYVQRPTRRAGWFVYGDDHLRQFVDYLRNQSRLARAGNYVANIEANGGDS